MTERRQSPRYEIDVAVNLVLTNNNVLSTHARNISSSGLQIICDRWATDEIEPRGIQNHATSHIRLKAITDLPIAKSKKSFYANCRIMSVQRLSQNTYMLNLAFIDFENSSENVLTEFLGQYDKKVVKATT